MLGLRLHDTIAAISTPPGRGALGIVRISGPQSASITREILKLRAELQPWRATRADLTVDAVIVTYFAAPRSYTAEDVIEISCHGAPVILRHCFLCVVLAVVLLAEPGVFSLC